MASFVKFHKPTITLPSFLPVVQAVKTGFAALASVALFALSGVTLIGSLIALTASTPLFVIFSPVLVPAAATTTMLAAGFTASGSLGTSAMAIFMFLYKRFTGKDPPSLPFMKTKAAAPPAAPAAPAADKAAAKPHAAKPSSSPASAPASHKPAAHKPASA